MGVKAELQEDWQQLAASPLLKVPRGSAAKELPRELRRLYEKTINWVSRHCVHKRGWGGGGVNR